MLLKAEFEAQMSYLEPSIEAMLTAGEGENNDGDDLDDNDDEDDDDDHNNGGDNERQFGDGEQADNKMLLTEDMSLAVLMMVSMMVLMIR